MGGMLKPNQLKDRNIETPAYEVVRKPFLRVDGKPSKFAKKVPNRDFYQERNSTRE